MDLQIQKGLMGVSQQDFDRVITRDSRGLSEDSANVDTMMGTFTKTFGGMRQKHTRMFYLTTSIIMRDVL